MDSVNLITPAEFVISKFGGLTGTAKAIGKPVTTVQGWKERGRVPQEHWQDLMNAAGAAGQEIELADFIKSHAAPTEGAAA